MEEVWKDISGYEGLYQISNLGRVKSLRRSKWNGRSWIELKERILKLFTLKPRGYKFVLLCKNSRYKNCYIHRLVLGAFVGPCPEGMESCHFPDRDPSNNRLDNLRWDVHKNNIADAKIHGTLVGSKGKILGEKNPNARLSECEVIKIRILYDGRKCTVSELAVMFDVSLGAVRSIIARRTWKHVED